MTGNPTEDLLRTLAPQVLGALLRRYGTEQFDLCEDAVQEALLEAYRQWTADGVPGSPLGWLVTTARRRMIDRIRSDARRREREAIQARLAYPLTHPLADLALVEQDDSLQVLMLCCHPVLTRSAQVALTLRTVAGLSTAQIASAYLLPEATIAQRISRAKARIKDTGACFPEPAGADADQRLDSVLTVIYLMFNEAHTTSSGAGLYNVDLAAEAIRLARQVHAELPDHGEAAGLLALLLLTDARRDARLDDRGRLVPLDEQDRSRWDQDKINDGVRLVQHTLRGRPPSPYLVQAAIAALHDQADSTDDTDWDEILALYTILEQLTRNPVVSLNRTVAAAMVHGPAYGLQLLDQVQLPADNHRLLAVRAHLLERTGDAAAADVYLQASRRTTSTAERDYLQSRARRLR